MPWEGIIFKQFISEPLIWFHNFLKVFSCYYKLLGFISHFILALGSGKGRVSDSEEGKGSEFCGFIYLFILNKNTDYSRLY